MANERYVLSTLENHPWGNMTNHEKRVYLRTVIRDLRMNEAGEEELTEAALDLFTFINSKALITVSREDHYEGLKYSIFEEMKDFECFGIPPTGTMISLIGPRGRYHVTIMPPVEGVDTCLVITEHEGQPGWIGFLTGKEGFRHTLELLNASPEKEYNFWDVISRPLQEIESVDA